MADFYRFLTDVFHGIESYAISGGATSSATISTGDMMQWDATARYATNNTLGSGAIFLGVCDETNPLASLGTATRPLTGGRLRIRSQGVFAMKSTAGETYSHLDPVYQGADVGTVSAVSSTRMVGRVHLPDGTQVTGGTTARVPVRMFGSMTNCGVAPSSTTAAR